MKTKATVIRAPEFSAYGKGDSGEVLSKGKIKSLVKIAGNVWEIPNKNLIFKNTTL